MDERGRRVGLNEAVFREVNERIEELAEASGLTDQPLDLVCECGDVSCTERITMTRAEYEAIRSQPDTFAVYPGHEVEDVEEVVEKHAGYDVVRKRSGAAAELAESTDPRSS